MPSLVHLPHGSSAPVQAFSGHPALAQRLLALGLHPGQTVQRGQQAPLAGPIQITCSGSVVALRVEDAQSLELGPHGTVHPS
ncbi:MAG: FeoA family protein [Verrucomicrobiia bacterium]